MRRPSLQPTGGEHLVLNDEEFARNLKTSHGCTLSALSASYFEHVFAKAYLSYFEAIYYHLVSY